MEIISMDVKAFDALAGHVEAIERKEQGYLIRTGNGGYETKVVVNAAGVYADKLHNMVSDSKMEIVPRKGEYLLYDKKWEIW